MRCILLSFFVLASSVLQGAKGQVPITESRCTVTFASVDEARQVLASRDEFVQRMSPFDRAARLKTDREVSEDEFLKFARDSVLAWEEDEVKRITPAVEQVAAALRAYRVKLPDKVLLLKTTGKEEGNAAYTRANAIVLPPKYMQTSEREIFRILCHELFHVISRTNPVLREKLYAAIGFEKCAEVFPPALLSRKITNPDAPRNDHCIRLEVAGKPQWAVPILFARIPKYDAAQGGEFFSYLDFKFLFVERGKDGAVTRLHEDPVAPRLFQIRNITGFFEQVGGNTGYIIHPEEILADNFALLMLGSRDVASPEILQKMEALLKE